MQHEDNHFWAAKMAIPVAQDRPRELSWCHYIEQRGNEDTEYVFKIF